MKRFLPIVLIFLLISCFDQSDCLKTATNLVKLDFETLAGVKQNENFIYVQQDSLLRKDSLGYFHRDSIYHFTQYERLNVPISTLSLTLNPLKDTTYFSFLTSDLKAFRLSLSYTTYTRLISTDCGAFLYYDGLTVNPLPPIRSDTIIYTPFDSTHVVSSQLLKSVSTNIKLLY